MSLVFLMFCVLPQWKVCDSLDIRLMNDVIHVKPTNEAIFLNLKIRNTSKQTFLLYNLNTEPEQAFFEESFYCNEDIAARASIIIYDGDMTQIHAHARIPKKINYKQITDEVLAQAMEIEKEKFRNTVQVAPAESSIEVSIKASLDDFHLAAGSYFIKLVYSSGENNRNMISEDDIAKDVTKYAAAMAKGCISSQAVRLIVE